MAIYAVGLAGVVDAGSGEVDKDKLKKAHNELDDLTEGTGGLAAYPSSLAVIDSIVLEMAHQIRSQYTIGYTPTNQALDGSYRTIRVRASTGPDRLTVRTRTGYRAVPSETSR
jgi:VWFA-related protein